MSAEKEDKKGHMLSQQSCHWPTHSSLCMHVCVRFLQVTLEAMALCLCVQLLVFYVQHFSSVNVKSSGFLSKKTDFYLW